MDLQQCNNTQTPVYSYTRTELLSLRPNTFLLSLSTVDCHKDLNIGYHLPRHHRSSRGVSVLTHIPFPPAQHGLRPKHSTCTALSKVNAEITASLSRKKPTHRTVIIALDLTSAFNKVDYQQLLDCAYNTNIPATIRRWLYNYMQNRRAKVHFWQQESKSRKVKTGVVQGRVMSPALSNYYLADFPTPPPNIKLTKYADDITIYASGSVLADLINGLNIYLSQVLNYIKMTVSTKRSTVILFYTRYTRAPPMPTSEAGRPSTTAQKKPKVFGVTLDTQLTFTHTATIL